MSLFAIWFWLAAGNISYQALGAQKWSEAFDHSYWQAIAISGVWLAGKLRSLLVPSEQCGGVK